MSLILRKECQTSLDKLGLTELHTEVKDKYLTLVGECGKTLIVISGISFTTSTPNKATIAYAVELFDKFLTKHSTSIISAVNLVKEVATLQKPISVGDNPTELDNTCKRTLSNGATVIYQDTKIYGGTKLYGSINTLETIDLVAKDKAFRKKVVTYFSELEKYNTRVTEAATAMNSIGQCNI